MDKMITIQKAASKTGISEYEILKLIRQHKINALNNGGIITVNIDTLNKLNNKKS